MQDDIRLPAGGFWVEPEDRWAWMRAHAPVHWDDEEGIWGLAAHEHSFLRGIVKRDFTVRRSRRSAGSARVAPHAPADERRRGLG